MQRLILFAKRPRPGEVKTRFVPPLSAVQALALYRAFLEDQISFLRQMDEGRDIELCSDLPWEEELPGISLHEQGPGDLGKRMSRAFDRSSAEGAAATIIIGADCPTLPAAHVRRAFELLENEAEAVLTPAEDGGYVLVGLSRPRPELFHAIPWGTADVLGMTRSRAQQHGIALLETEGWYDVDDIGGIRRLRSDLSITSRAPATLRALQSLVL
jgi:rSAM/selenodomain-associated transferase 1